MKNSQGIKTIQGLNPGKTISIMAGVHGNETCGLEAFKSILPNLLIENGKVNFIHGNPRAIIEGKRQIEMNLNRAFRDEELLQKKEKNTYERNRALELMPYLDESSSLLDIHSSGTEKSIPFIICEPHSFCIAERLPFPIKTYGWDAIQPGGTDYYVNKKGGQGICIECGFHTDPSVIECAKNSIKQFLILTGCVLGEMPKKHDGQKTIHVYKMYVTKDNFRPVRDFSDFELLNPGELIGQDGVEEICAPSEAGNLIIFARKREGGGEEAFILGREE